MIRHISLDAWGTLIRPNPTFGTQRDAMWQRMSGKSLDHCIALRGLIKDAIDTRALDGEGVSVQWVYNKVREGLGMSESHTNDLREWAEATFFQYPPESLARTADILFALVDKGINISILSNTGFIGGTVLDLTLRQRCGFGDSVSFGIYSDLEQSAKPNPRIFAEMLRRARLVRHRDDHLHTYEILHIGDHARCDGGAQRAGHQFHLIKSLSETADILEHVHQHDTI